MNKKKRNRRERRERQRLVKNAGSPATPQRYGKVIGVTLVVAGGLWGLFSGTLSNIFADQIKARYLSQTPPIQTPAPVKIKHEEWDSILAELSKLIKEFDSGETAAADEMAKILKNALYSYPDEPSLLTKAGLESTLLFFNAASELTPEAWSPYSGLVSMEMKKAEGKNAPLHGRYFPRPQQFSNSPQSLIPFPVWWNALILDDKAGHQFTRKTLVLAVAKFEGNEPMRKYAADDYKALTQPEYLGWSTSGRDILGPTITVDGSKRTEIHRKGETPFTGRPDLITVRGIAEEVLATFAKQPD